MSQLPIELGLTLCERLDLRANESDAHAARVRAASDKRRGDIPEASGFDRSPAELEFTLALRAYQASSGRMFPTWSEVLEVLHSLGYASGGGANRGG